MEIDAELAFLRELLHRLLFPHRRVVLDVVPDLWRQDEEAAIDPAAIANWLLLELDHAVALVIDRSEAAGGLGRGHCGEPPFSAMQIDRSADVYIANAVTISQNSLSSPR